MKQSDLIFAEFVKDVLVNMTIECELPSDMTQLDMTAVFEKARQKAKQDDAYNHALRIEKLGDYVRGNYDGDNDFNTMKEVLEALEKQAEIDGSVRADEVVSMWMHFENAFSVDELLDEIDPTYL